jgi:hypothetical protein
VAQNNAWTLRRAGFGNVHANAIGRQRAVPDINHVGVSPTILSSNFVLSNRMTSSLSIVVAVNAGRIDRATVPANLHRASFDASALRRRRAPAMDGRVPDLGPRSLA